MLSDFHSVQWIPYNPERRKGKLCYYNCTADSDLPLRDLRARLTEPNYETATYNYCGPCLQKIHLGPAVKARLNLPPSLEQV